MANSGSLSVPPRGLHDVFLPAFQEVQVGASSTAKELAHWVVPFDADFVALHYNMTVAGATHTTDDFDLFADGSSIMTGNIDTLDTAATHRGTILCGAGSTDVPPANKFLSAGTILTLKITTSANSTVDNMAFCLVLRPIHP